MDLKTVYCFFYRLKWWFQVVTGWGKVPARELGQTLSRVFAPRGFWVECGLCCVGL